MDDEIGRGQKNWEWMEKLDSRRKKLIVDEKNRQWMKKVDNGWKKWITNGKTIVSGLKKWIEVVKELILCLWRYNYSPNIPITINGG